MFAHQTRSETRLNNLCCKTCPVLRLLPIMNLTDEVIFLNLNGGNSEEEKESTPHQTRLNGVYATWGGGGGG